jgi:hypothetical protein
LAILGVIDTAVHKIGDLLVNFNFLHAFEAILKKALTRVSGAWGSSLMKKNQG